MYGYASSAMTATQLTPFTAPPQTTNSAGPAGQTAAAARVVSGSAGTGTQTALAQLITAMPGALQGLASPAQATSPLQALFLVTLGLSVASLSTSSSAAVYSSMNSRVLVDNSQAILNNSDILLNSQDQLSRTGQQILERIQKLRPTGTPSAIAGGSGVGRAPVLVSASMGQAASAGRLSVPVSWAAAAPEIRAAAYGLPATSVDAAPAASARAAGTAFSEMAFAGMGGSALAGTVSRGRQEYIEATAGDHVKSPQRALESPVTKMAAGIRELGELRDSGLLTDKEFN
jgi:PPE-repeat protein